MRINPLVRSQPVLVLTGAGASKWLGKATTFDFYDSPEIQETSIWNPLSPITELRGFLMKRPDEVVDLEILLDHARDLNRAFDNLNRTPPYQGQLGKGSNIRDQLGEAYERLLDFVVDYYGSIDREPAIAIWKPFLDGLRKLLSKAWRKHPAVSLFTLNYDEAIDTAVDALPGHGLVDGFDGGLRPTWRPGVFDEAEAGPGRPVPVFLFKLHGSVSWTKAPGSDVIERTVDVPRRRPGRDHVILYPTQSPKQNKMEPFATAYAHFKAALAGCSVAVFIGTSFRDKELLELLQERRNAGPFALLAMRPDADAKSIAKKTGHDPDHVFVVPLSFEPDNIPALMDKIGKVLQSAPSTGAK